LRFELFFDSHFFQARRMVRRPFFSSAKRIGVSIDGALMFSLSAGSQRPPYAGQIGQHLSHGVCEAAAVMAAARFTFCRIVGAGSAWLRRPSAKLATRPF
jgi:hypothetical protein